MKEDSITKLIHEQQLASVMNRTKWRELADAMTSNPDYFPLVRVKYVWDEPADNSFAHLDWELMRHETSRMVEWIDIDSVRRNRVGRLVEDTTTDFSDWVRASLEKHSIPFVEDGCLFRVYGYLRPNG